MKNLLLTAGAAAVFVLIFGCFLLFPVQSTWAALVIVALLIYVFLKGESNA